MHMIIEEKFSPVPRGFAPLIAIVILVALALAAGGGFYAYRAVKAPAAPAAPTPVAEGVQPSGQTEPAAGGDALAGIAVAAPSIEMPSASALPGLEVSALNLSSAALPSTGIFRDLSAKTDTSYSYKLDIATPEVQIDAPAAPAAPSGGSTGGSGTGGGQTTPSASSCAQFSSMPSAQYCSMVSDPNGQTLCQACKSAGF